MSDLHLSRIRLSSIQVNPLRLASAAFLLLSPFTIWITIVSVVIYQDLAIFGTAAQSNLFQVSAQQFGTNVSQAQALGASLSLLLMPIGGILLLFRFKTGTALATAGLLSYIVPMYSMFGETTSGLELTFISPGLGVFSAAVGIALAVLSPLAKSSRPSELARFAKTKQGLASIGIFVGAVTLFLDGANHAALGQLWDFVGTTPSEQVLHLGLIGGILAAVVVAFLGRRVPRDRLLILSGSLTLLLLGLDAAFNISNGTLNQFLGHNLTETGLHLSVYYGVALLNISAFLPNNQRA